jgi:energy-converting hydrogenase Eha subunit E
MSKGRTVPPLPEVTLPHSGYTVQIRPIGPLTINELGKAVRKEIPAPAAPLNDVTGLDGRPGQEANEADPDYIAALEAYETKVNAEVGARILKLIAVRAIASPVDTEAVQQLRADMAAVGVTLPDDDREVFFNHILVVHTDDLTAIQTAVLQRSMPTEEVVKQKTADFLDPVQAA